MKFFVLSDKPDVYLGMRLAGMDGAVVENRTEALDKIREIVAAKEVGILLITGELMDQCEPELTAIRRDNRPAGHDPNFRPQRRKCHQGTGTVCP